MLPNFFSCFISLNIFLKENESPYRLKRPLDFLEITKNTLKKFQVKCYLLFY